MDIKETRNGDELTIAISGELNVSTAADFDGCLAENLGGVNSLIIDCSGLKYISSAGLRSLLSAYKEMSGRNGKLAIKNCNESVKEVFNITGFDTVLPVE